MRRRRVLPVYSFCWLGRNVRMEQSLAGPQYSTRNDTSDAARGGKEVASTSIKAALISNLANILQVIFAGRINHTTLVPRCRFSERGVAGALLHCGPAQGPPPPVRDERPRRVEAAAVGHRGHAHGHGAAKRPHRQERKVRRLIWISHRADELQESKGSVRDGL